MENFNLTLDAAFWITVAAIVALLLMSAFFSGSETALTAASRGKLRSQADRGSRGAARALKITEDNERLIGSVLLGNNFVNILAASHGDGPVHPAVSATMRCGPGDAGDDRFWCWSSQRCCPRPTPSPTPKRAAALVSRPISDFVVLVFSPPSSRRCGLLRARRAAAWSAFSTDPDSHILAVREERSPGHLQYSATPKASSKRKTATASLGALDLRRPRRRRGHAAPFRHRDGRCGIADPTGHSWNNA